MLQSVIQHYQHSQIKNTPRHTGSIPVYTSVHMIYDFVLGHEHQPAAVRLAPGGVSLTRAKKKKKKISDKIFLKKGKILTVNHSTSRFSSETWRDGRRVRRPRPFHYLAVRRIVLLYQAACVTCHPSPAACHRKSATGFKTTGPRGGAARVTRHELQDGRPAVI